MKDEIKKLQEEKDMLYERINKIDKAITAFQEVCIHEAWEDCGHDSHHSYEKCIDCGYERKA